jgi:hypothetical protein
VASYTIVAVRTGSVAAPFAHDHIEAVKLDDGTVLSRADVIVNISHGHVYYTNGSPPALVIVHRCPHCGAGNYITTHPDSTTANNLLDLPRF